MVVGGKIIVMELVFEYLMLETTVKINNGGGGEVVSSSHCRPTNMAHICEDI